MLPVVVFVAGLAVVAVAVAAGLVRGTSGPDSSSAGSLDPAQFASGSCVAFPGDGPGPHPTVFLDAGHGGIDPGGVGTAESGRTVDEGRLTLPVEMDAMRLLVAKGYRVVVSRTTDSTVLRLRPGDVSGNALTLSAAHDDVAARDVCANEAGAQVLVGIYYDTGSSTANAGGLTAYDSARPFAAANQRLATVLQRDVVAAMDARGWAIPDDGVLSDGSLGSLAGNPSDGGLAAQAAAYHHLLLLGPGAPGYFSTPSQMPGAIIEPLFLTDPFEASIADSSQGQQVIAGGIARAVEQYLRLPAATGSTTSTSGPASG